MVACRLYLRGSSGITWRLFSTLDGLRFNDSKTEQFARKADALNAEKVLVKVGQVGVELSSCRFLRIFGTTNAVFCDITFPGKRFPLPLDDHWKRECKSATLL